MRRLFRVELPVACQSYLDKKQRAVDSGKAVGPLWKQSRKTRTMNRVFETLALMTGTRRRCMYCEDSRGTTIEHFRPKSAYPERSFVWLNLLFVCQGCQSRKGDRFASDPAGEPLLIDPTAEDPWLFLFFDSHTGNLVGRYPAGRDQPHPKGEHTADPKTLPLNIEAVTEGRLRTTRNLRRAVNAFLAASPESDETRRTLLDAIRDNDDYGLAIWFFHLDGSEESPFRELKEDHEPIWGSITHEISRP